VGSATDTDPDPDVTVNPQAGSAMLQLTESPHYGTPQAYIAYVEGLTDGDQVTASFYGWDSTDGASPSLRIWGHYAVSGDVTSYNGSASGNSTYTGGSGAGWYKVDYTWTFDSDSGARDALVVEARLYSTPSTCDPCSTDFWIDTLHVEAPDGSTVTVAPEPMTMALLGLGAVGVLLRRRR